MTPAALAQARASLHSGAEAVRLRLVRSAERLAEAVEDWRDSTAPQRGALVIEDSIELARLTALTIEQSLGCEALVATSYDEALRLLSAPVPYLVVVLDVDLGDPHGRTGLSLLDVARRTIPVVISTGKVERDQIQAIARRAAARPHIKGEQDLVDVVREAIAAHGGDL